MAWTFDRFSYLCPQFGVKNQTNYNTQILGEKEGNWFYLLASMCIHLMIILSINYGLDMIMFIYMKFALELIIKGHLYLHLYGSKLFQKK